jgi:hypothetical protein
MAGSKPKVHQRSVDGTSYTIETSQHEHGISIVVCVPGIGPEEENDRTFASEEQALSGGDDVARLLIRNRRS